MNDLLAGHVQVSLATAPSAVPHIKSGKIKALGVSSKQRLPALPDVAPITDSGLPGYEASQFFGLVAPPGTPPAIINRIHAAVVKVMKDPAMARYLNEQGADPVTSASPAEYGAFIREEVAKWGKVVKDTGAKVD
jgi:tripartite-type tricarboxylate transporter receptor subunit TctC